MKEFKDEFKIENNDIKNRNEVSGIRKPTIIQVTIFYIVEIMLFVSFSFLIGKLWPKNYPIMLLLVLDHTLLILTPPLVFLKVFKYDFKKTLRLNKVSIPIFFNTIFLMLFAIFLTSFINFIYMVFYAKFIGKVSLQNVPLLKGVFGFFINILVIAIMPAIFEEILFRGTIQRGFERIGYVKAAIITGVLFGIMHLNQYQFVGLALLGCFIGYIVYRTNSLYMGMLAHFINNALTIVLQFASDSLQKYFNQTTNKTDINKLIQNVNLQMIFGIMFMIVILALFVAGLIVLLNYLTRNIVEKAIDKAD